MKKITFLLLTLTFYNNLLFADCVEATSSANYVILHTKKSINADNFDHQRYFADRAIDAFLKTKKSMDNCGCDEALSAIESGLINLRRAADPEDWDKGRFYAKRALEDADLMMSALDVCTSGSRNTSINYESSTYSNAEQNLISEQQRIEEQKKRLEEEQKRLEKQLEEQRKLQEQLSVARQKELDLQLMVKNNTEAAIANYEQSLNSLISALSCADAKKVMATNYTKTQQDLEKETLGSTKRFYLEKILTLQRDAMNSLQQLNCN